MRTCWGIVKGEYSDYKVLAIFSTEEKARDQLETWGGEDVEEFPFDDFQPKRPKGMENYAVYRSRGEITAYRNSDSMMHLRKHGDAVVYGQVTYLWARNEEHAIKIAAERFARYDARKAGIA
jgi:hypothetical protein